MDPSRAFVLSPTFESWVEEGMQLSTEPEFPDLVDVYLECPVPAATLLLIKRDLAPEARTTELVELGRRAPVRLLRAVPYGPALVVWRAINLQQACLSMRRVDSPNDRVPMSDLYPKWSLGQAR
jgi:hypothetical protein